jgi:hypothetical protein
MTDRQWDRLREMHEVAINVADGLAVEFLVGDTRVAFTFHGADKWHFRQVYPLRELDFDARDHDKAAQFKAGYLADFSRATHSIKESAR